MGGFMGLTYKVTVVIKRKVFLHLYLQFFYHILCHFY